MSTNTNVKTFVEIILCNYLLTWRCLNTVDHQAYFCKYRFFLEYSVYTVDASKDIWLFYIHLVMVYTYVLITNY